MADRYETMSTEICFQYSGQLDKQSQKILDDLGGQGWEIKALVPFSITASRCNVLLQRVVR